MLGRGWVDEETSTALLDPEIVGAIVVMVSEGWYFLAKKFDWAK